MLRLRLLYHLLVDCRKNPTGISFKRVLISSARKTESVEAYAVHEPQEFDVLLVDV